MNPPQPYSLDEKVIGDLLSVTGLARETCAQRAASLVADLKWINFENFRAFCGAYPYLDPRSGQLVRLRIPEYRFGETNFTVHNAANPQTNNATWFRGTGLDRGHLQFLSRAGEIARKVIPAHWRRSKKLRDNLRNPTQHLSTVDEIWWLGRWRGIEAVELERKIVPGSGAGIDWWLRVGGSLQVNLEVKRIVRDCMRHARLLPFDVRWFAEFCAAEVLPKFRPSRPDEVNLLAISLFGEIDRGVQMVVSDWLRSGQNVIDGVLIATREARRKSQFDQQLLTEKARLIRHLIEPPHGEDCAMAFVLEVPVDVPGLNLFSKTPSD